MLGIGVIDLVDARHQRDGRRAHRLAIHRDRGAAESRIAVRAPVLHQRADQISFVAISFERAVNQHLHELVQRDAHAAERR